MARNENQGHVKDPEHDGRLKENRGHSSTQSHAQSRGEHRSQPHSQTQSHGKQEARSHDSGGADLKQREYKDEHGEVHHHTHTYMEQHRGEKK